jgi:hypothetical protein
MIYIHETIQLQPDRVDDFMSAFQTSYLPHMVDLGASLVGVWETVSLVLPWPQVIVLWEVDGLDTVSALVRAQYGDARARFAEWRSAAGRMCTGGQGRMLQPSALTPTLAELRASNVPLEMCVHEWIETAQNRGEDYCRQLELRYAPAAGKLNRVLVGTYHEVWDNREVINLWALPDPSTIFPAAAGIRGATGPEDDDIHSWIVLSTGIRQGFKSGLIHQLKIDE